MVVVGADRLIAGDPGADLDALDEADLLELLEDPVDRGARYAAAAGPRPPRSRTPTARTVAAHQLDQLPPGAAAPIAGVSESGQRLFCPLLLLG